MKFELTHTNSNYPIITDELINCLFKDFPNQLPEKEISEFELGRLIGQQDIINKLIREKEYNENNVLELD